VFRLLAPLAARAGAVPVLLERDTACPPLTELLDELARARACLAAGAAVGTTPPPGSGGGARAVVPGAAAGPGLAEGTLGRGQALLARLLTGPSAASSGTAAEPFAAAAVARTRGVLARKRVEEALPLLPRLRRLGDPVRILAHAVVAETPPACAGAAAADAARIAAAALAQPGCAAAARLDALVLRARFRPARAGGAPGPRRGPFVGGAALPDGGTVWAWKGPGAQAPVRLWSAAGGSP
jgi:hypothetical protein